MNDIINNLDKYILSPLVTLMFSVAVLVFLWGLVEFIWKADSDTGRETGKQHMLWGIIGMFIMVASIGIINIFLNTFGISTIR